MSPLKGEHPDPQGRISGHAVDRPRTARVSRIAVLGATDALALFLAGIAAYVLWALPARRQSLALYLETAPLIAVFLVGYAQAGLYPGFGARACRNPAAPLVRHDLRFPPDGGLLVRPEAAAPLLARHVHDGVRAQPGAGAGCARRSSTAGPGRGHGGQSRSWWSARESALRESFGASSRPALRLPAGGRARA